MCHVTTWDVQVCGQDLNVSIGHSVYTSLAILYGICKDKHGSDHGHFMNTKNVSNVSYVRPFSSKHS